MPQNIFLKKQTSGHFKQFPKIKCSLFIIYESLCTTRDIWVNYFSKSLIIIQVISFFLNNLLSWLNSIIINTDFFLKVIFKSIIKPDRYPLTNEENQNFLRQWNDQSSRQDSKAKVNENYQELCIHDIPMYYIIY